MESTDWLPELCRLCDYDGDWTKYKEALYGYYTQDFIYSRPIYKGVALKVKREPINDGKHATFWHIIQSGDIECKRTPDMNRCERIRWPKPIIDECDKHKMLIWENERHDKGEKKNICIFYTEADYLIILRKRDDGLYLWSAYPIDYGHRRRKLIKEYSEWIKKTRDAV
jgi:hypothetical protein